MISYTHNDHFKFGYNDAWFNTRTSAADCWHVTYGRCSRPPKDFRTECANVARLIRESTSEKLIVMFSGGVDSEVCMRAFKDAGIAVEAGILRFKDYYNLHDISWAIEYCEANRVRYRLYDLDVLRFWEKENYDYAGRVQCVSPQFTVTMWLMDQVDGFPVLGSAECYFAKRVPPGYKVGVSPYSRTAWDLFEREKVAAWYRHLMVRERAGVPGFFQYTPEVMLAFSLDPTVRDLVNDRLTGRLSTMKSKLGIYQRYYPEIRGRKKYTGFELLQVEDQIHRARLVALYPNSQAELKTEYHELIRMLSPDGLSDAAKPDGVAGAGIRLEQPSADVSAPAISMPGAPASAA